MKNVIKITHKQFKDEILSNWGIGTAPSSISYITTPKLTQIGKEKFGEVTKVANIGCLIGYDYENSVNLQREREGEIKNFLSEPLWKGAGKRITAALSTHMSKGTFYLTYKKQQTYKSFYLDQNLNIIPNAIIKQFFPPISQTSKQGTEQRIYHREILLENVRKVKFRKTTYVLEG